MADVNLDVDFGVVYLVDKGSFVKIVADKYSAEQTYAVGDYVLHNDLLYKCITAIDEPEEFDAEKWVACKLANEVKSKADASSLATVATSGSYNDLLYKPTIPAPQVNSDWNANSGVSQILNKPNLATVATSGDYNDLNNKPSVAVIDDSQASASKTYSSEKVNNLFDNKYEQKLTQTLKVGENILTEASVVLGSNWSGSLINGFTHTSGSTDTLTFNIPTTSGKAYLITFNANNVSAKFLYTKIGNTPDVDCYNGRTDFYIGIVSDGGNLIFTPKSNLSSTITNLKLREIVDEGEEVVFGVDNIKTPNSNSGLTGFWNVAIGTRNFENNINGSRNISIGTYSLEDFKSGTRNVGVGTYALNSLESGDSNIGIGADAMWNTKKAEGSIAIGTGAMNGAGNGSDNNIAIGMSSLSGIVSGTDNVAIGHLAMSQPKSDGVSNSVCIGNSAGMYADSNNVYIGNRAGYHLKNTYNVAIGSSAGNQANIDGQYNVFIGYASGIDNTDATASNPKTVNKSIAIGRQAKVTKNNQMMLGSSEITEVVFCGNKKIMFNNDGTVTWEQLT